LSHINFNPDERSGFSKLWSKKTTFPDNFSGEITKLSDAKFDAKKKTYKLNKDYFTYVKIDGDWSKSISFDDTILWDYDTFMHYELERVEYTLPSDSTLREDLLFLKSGNEDQAQKEKIRLEDAQRNDRKLREKYVKSLALGKK